MKKGNNKRDFDRFSQKSSRKSQNRDKARAALMRAVLETGVGVDALKIAYTHDGGRAARISDKIRRDEILAKGVFSASKSGFGFVSIEGCERDIFIPEDKTLGALEGDLVEIVYHSYTSRFGEEKTEGRVKKILKYGRRTVIGTVSRDCSYRYGKKYGGSRFILIPDDQKFSPCRIALCGLVAEEGDKIEAVLDRTSYPMLECRITRVFGNAESRSANYEAIIAESEIPTDFSREELAEAEFFASSEVGTEGRADRRRELIFTIDGADAKDLDDAISVRKLRGGGWQLGVHIADVSFYVRERTHLDRAAMARGTSVYFTDKVIPMLPPSLSNGACSLNAGEDKYAISATVKLTSEGKIDGVRLEPSVIRSRVRGVYSEVNEIFNGTHSAEIARKYKSVLPALIRARELYAILKKKSESRGALELDSTECEIILSPDGTPTNICRRERGEAEKMIEQFMLCANEAVATLLYREKIPCVYRVHEEPPPEKLSDLILYLHNLGFDTSFISRERTTPADLGRTLAEADRRGILAPVSHVMLRSMAKARYSDACHAHFGLAISTYCHFTSPIRRLSDLATHRIIRRVLFEGKRPEAYAAYARRAAAAATDAELRALQCERKIENLYKVVYMSSFIGEEFEATVSSVTSFGFFAELSNGCEGLVPLSELPGVFTFDEGNLTLRSKYRTYALGDAVRVRLEEADISRGKLRFSVAVNEPT
ncbi:MAG: VacB/RNase II family 3'-5' exoribonuclease [Clostridia bacterium]|nr:VacB/RNase II family 3'-5' exoribonuclease [Clostridia bacterium]